MDHKRFIKGLEKEHAIILQAFKKLEPIIKNGNVSNAANALEIIKQLKTTLVKHLCDEDNLFYPAMRKRAVEVKQNALLPALDMFIEDMANISKKVLDFFSRYETENAILEDEKDFISSIVELRDVLIKRVNSEEGTLYYIYMAYHNI